MVVVSYIWYVIKYRQQDNVLYQGLKMPGSITDLEISDRGVTACKVGE